MESQAEQKIKAPFLYLRRGYEQIKKKAQQAKKVWCRQCMYVALKRAIEK